MGAIAVPGITRFIAPITVAQARKPRLRVFHLANTKKSRRKSATPQNRSASSTPTPVPPQLTRIETDNVRHNVEDLDDDNDEGSKTNVDDGDDDQQFYGVDSGPSQTSVNQEQEDPEMEGMQSSAVLYGLDAAGISSLPDLRQPKFREEDPHPHPSSSATSVVTHGSFPPKKRAGNHVHPVIASTLTMSAKIRLLKSNYFRYETAFAYALQAISTRLRLVPKPARLSALRAEITLLNNELPAEVDIPMILETDTYRATPRLHKIVRISPTEATVLNSAERVPFLLIIEVLKNDVTFDPDTARNQDILNNPADYRSLFNFAYSSNSPSHLNLAVEPSARPLQKEKLTETELGDISVAALADISDDQGNEYTLPNVPTTPLPNTDELHNSNSSSPRSTDLSFASSYPISRASSIPIPRNTSDLNDIAVHMRTAATMLAQLDLAQGQSQSHQIRLPKDEIQQIKARIIQSMQVLEEQSTFEDVESAASFPVSRLSTSSVRSHNSTRGPPGVNKEAGERRMENDLKTGVIKSDETEVGFGEEWEAKKKRIRAMSPYGHLPNWDLVSVIAKTGSDLRQEAFACQIIQAIKRIWEEADVDIWVRRMAILVTGAGSGLVETITNGVSLHSLKKALATSMLGQSDGPHKGNKVASLSEYFFRVFGVRGSERFKKAQSAFMKSLAAYSLICYLLQIKDRHNGNILLDTEGHIVRMLSRFNFWLQ